MAAGLGAHRLELFLKFDSHVVREICFCFPSMFVRMLGTAAVGFFFCWMLIVVKWFDYLWVM